MDIRNVGNPGNVTRSGERSERAASAPAVVIPAVARDDARISAAGRETAAAIEGLAERARRDDTGREALVAAAAAKLAEGRLDDPAVLAATAQRLVDGRFLSV